MIPLIAIGPSWAVWPSLADIVVLFLLPFAVLQPMIDKTARRVWVALVAWTVVCSVSFIVITVFNVLGSGASGAGKGIGFGEFGLYRLLQLLVVFRAVTACKMTPKRLRALHYVTLATFFLICVGVWATYLNVISPLTLSSHLPHTKLEAGAWIGYMHRDEGGLGAIGYNHGYVALQLILSAIVALFLGDVRGSSAPLRVIVLISCLGSVLLSGSRAGLIAVVLFSAFELLSTQRRSIPTVCAIVGAIILSLTFIKYSVPSEMSEAVDRTQTISTSFESDGLSGRTLIWEDRATFLQTNPLRWIVGSGFGSAIDGGNNAHMLPLQVVTELGLTGAFVFCWLGFRISQRLRFVRGKGGVVMRGSIALLTTCLTQETFYPVPAFGHFLSFFFVVVALVIWHRRLDSDQHSSHQTQRAIRGNRTPVLV